MKNSNLAFGVDIGGTKILVALVDVEVGKVVDHRLISTKIAAGPIAIMDEIAQAINVLKTSSTDPLKIGLAVAGQIDPIHGIVRFAPNLAWRDFSLKQQLSTLTNAPVYITNDVRAAAWGEWMYGAGRGCEDGLYLFFGTGIGGAIVSAGKMLVGASNTAGELGHIVVDYKGPLCTCGNRGCFEAHAGGWAIARDLKAAVRNDPIQAHFLLELVQGHSEKLTAKNLFQGYEAKDPLSVHLFEELVDVTSGAVSGLVNAFNPKRLVFGGGIIMGAPYLVEKVQTGIEKRSLNAALESMEVTISSLGSDAGVIGAAAFALQS